MFSSHIENPKNCRFEGQDPDENILLLLRAHPITNLSWIIPVIFLFFLPFIASLIIPFTEVSLSFVPDIYLTIALVFNFLLILIISFEGYLYWYFNVYIVTDKNIVDVDFHSILFKNIDIAPLRNIEDVSSSMGGLLSSIFNYGDVLVQTAGTSKNIDFASVANPHYVADFILDHSHNLHGKGLNANQQPH